jgi:hypothetical protein
MPSVLGMTDSEWCTFYTLQGNTSKYFHFGCLGDLPDAL